MYVKTGIRLDTIVDHKKLFELFVGAWQQEFVNVLDVKTNEKDLVSSMAVACCIAGLDAISTVRAVSHDEIHYMFVAGGGNAADYIIDDTKKLQTFVITVDGMADRLQMRTLPSSFKIGELDLSILLPHLEQKSMADILQTCPAVIALGIAITAVRKKMLASKVASEFKEGNRSNIPAIQRAVTANTTLLNRARAFHQLDDDDSLIAGFDATAMTGAINYLLKTGVPLSDIAAIICASPI